VLIGLVCFENSHSERVQVVSLYPWTTETINRPSVRCGFLNQSKISQSITVETFVSDKIAVPNISAGSTKIHNERTPNLGTNLFQPRSFTLNPWQTRQISNWPEDDSSLRPYFLKVKVQEDRGAIVASCSLVEEQSNEHIHTIHINSGRPF